MNTLLDNQTIVRENGFLNELNTIEDVKSLINNNLSKETIDRLFKELSNFNLIDPKTNIKNKNTVIISTLNANNLLKPVAFKKIFLNNLNKIDVLENEQTNVFDDFLNKHPLLLRNNAIKNFLNELNEIGIMPAIPIWCLVTQIESGSGFGCGREVKKYYFNEAKAREALNECFVDSKHLIPETAVLNDQGQFCVVEAKARIQLFPKKINGTMSEKMKEKQKNLLYAGKQNEIERKRQCIIREIEKLEEQQALLKKQQALLNSTTQ